MEFLLFYIRNYQWPMLIVMIYWPKNFVHLKNICSCSYICVATTLTPSWYTIIRVIIRGQQFWKQHRTEKQIGGCSCLRLNQQIISFLEQKHVTIYNRIGNPSFRFQRMYVIRSNVLITNPYKLYSKQLFYFLAQNVEALSWLNIVGGCSCWELIVVFVELEVDLDI